MVLNRNCSFIRLPQLLNWGGIYLSVIDWLSLCQLWYASGVSNYSFLQVCWIQVTVATDTSDELVSSDQNYRLLLTPLLPSHLLFSNVPYNGFFIYDLVSNLLWIDSNSSSSFYCYYWSDWSMFLNSFQIHNHMIEICWNDDYVVIFLSI